MIIEIHKYKLIVPTLFSLDTTFEQLDEEQLWHHPSDVTDATHGQSFHADPDSPVSYQAALLTREEEWWSQQSHQVSQWNFLIGVTAFMV